jgi:NADH dehydrogenase
METRSVATVVGGSGFLGRYVVKRLAAAGHIVRVAVRDPESAMALRPMGRVGQIVPLFCNAAPAILPASRPRAPAGSRAWRPRPA